MMGDYHPDNYREFCERLGVKLPLPTRLQTVIQYKEQHDTPFNSRSDWKITKRK